MSAEADSILEAMKAQVINRKKSTVTMTAPGGKVQAPSAPAAEPRYSASIDQARDITVAAVESMRATAAALREQADALDTAARHLDYGMDLVYSIHTDITASAGKPLDIEAMKRKAEAEADARHRGDGIVPGITAHFDDGHLVSQHLTIKSEPEIVHLSNEGWACPDHGMAVIKTSARTGREYKACPVDGCGEIERR